MAKENETIAERWIRRAAALVLAVGVLVAFLAGLMSYKFVTQEAFAGHVKSDSAIAIKLDRRMCWLILHNGGTEKDCE